MGEPAWERHHGNVRIHECNEKAFGNLSLDVPDVQRLLKAYDGQHIDIDLTVPCPVSLTGDEVHWVHVQINSTARARRC